MITNSARWRSLALPWLTDYKKTASKTYVVSSAFLDVIIFAISARLRSLALAGCTTKTQYIEDIVSSAFLDAILFYNKCSLSFTGFGQVAFKNAMHQRRRFKCGSECNTF